MDNAQTYVREDENGVLRVAASRVMLDSVVAAFHEGCSPETIQQQYPALSLEEVYGALTYYLSHVDEVGAYLKRQDRIWEDLRTRAGAVASPVVQRLRALRKARAAEAS